MVAWTEEQRTAARILRENFPKLTHQQRADTFNYLFEDERKETVSLKTLKDAYDRRRERRAAKGWREICDLDNPTDIEKQRRSELRKDIGERLQEAVDALRKDLKGYSGDDEYLSDSSITSLSDEGEDAEATIDDQKPIRQGSGSLSDLRASEYQDNDLAGEDKEEVGAAKVKTAPSSSIFRAAGSDGTQPATDAAPPKVLDTSNGDHEFDAIHLEMVHYRDCVADSKSNIRCTTDTFVEHESEVHKLGGKVYRCAMLDGMTEDVMICNRHFCAYCITRDATKLYEDLGNGPIPDSVNWLESRPFVHASDCRSPESYTGSSADNYMVFNDSDKTYDSQHPLPAHMFTPVVIFKDRSGDEKKLRVVMCQAAYCVECSGEKKVRETIERYGQ